jgi:fatty-acyl-CoA synthase
MEALARAMLAHGAKPGDKVAFYMRNGAAYGETAGACFLASLTHANINYRFNAEEVFYIADNADAAVLVYGAEFRPIVAQIRHRLNKLVLFIEVGDAPPPAFAQSYEHLAADETLALALPPRSPENQVLAYTGGTTGMPKGVVFQQGELAPYLWRISALFATELPARAADVASLIRARGEANRR